MAMQQVLARAALCLLGATEGSALDAQVIERPQLSAALQLALAVKAQGLCRAQGQEVVVAVADASGTVRTLISADGAGQLSVESAMRKAHSAAWLGFPTGALVKASTEAPAFADFLKGSDSQIVMFAGGLPIRVRGQLVGAIGVGGAPKPDLDEGCAKAALDAMADQIK